MGKLRTPLIIMIIITILAASAETATLITGPREYQGALIYVYTQGETPIGLVTFTFDDQIADKLLIVAAPSGWTYTLTGNLMTLSGGPISPGGQLTIRVSAWKYIQPGNYPFTAQGGGATARGELLVKDMPLTGVIWALYDNLIILVALTLLLAAGEIYIMYRSRQAEQTPSDQQPPHTP